MDLNAHIRNVPDFPQPGIQFKDITPLLGNPTALAYVIDTLAARYFGQGIEYVVGVESRGFIFGAPLAYRLGAGFVPVRKKGKLPADTIEESYDLEYGKATIEIHKDAVRKGAKVLVVDDVLATGGTLAATCGLVERAGGAIAEVVTIIELSFLDGTKKLGARKYYSLLKY